MYLIALCDDETEELNKAERMLQKYKKQHAEAEFQVRRFTDAEELLRMIRGGGFKPDLILLDIQMPQKQGIEVAKELRDMGIEGRIIFITMSREYALEAFSVDAVQYLVKPITEGRLFPVLEKVLGELDEERRKYIILRIEGRTQRVAVNDIAYCEANGKTQNLYLADGTHHVLRATMAEIGGMLCRYEEFVRVGVAYLVNLEHVESLNAQELYMDGGQKIYPPRGSYQPLREKYFEYYCNDG